MTNIMCYSQTKLYYAVRYSEIFTVQVVRDIPQKRFEFKCTKQPLAWY